MSTNAAVAVSASGFVENATEPDLKWDVFISHAQHSGQDQAAVIARELGKRGADVWWDQKTDGLDITKEGMAEGVKKSGVFLMFLSEGIFSRPFCRLELQAALESRKKIYLVHEYDDRHGKFIFDPNEYLKDVPPEWHSRIRELIDGNRSAQYQREEKYANLFLDSIVDDVLIREIKPFYYSPEFQAKVRSELVKAWESIFCSVNCDWLCGEHHVSFDGPFIEHKIPMFNNCFPGACCDEITLSSATFEEDGRLRFDDPPFDERDIVFEYHKKFKTILNKESREWIELKGSKTRVASPAPQDDMKR